MKSRNDNINELRIFGNGALARSILSSINQHHESIDKTWSDEVEARIIAYDSDDLIAIDQKDVFAKYQR